MDSWSWKLYYYCADEGTGPLTVSHTDFSLQLEWMTSRKYNTTCHGYLQTLKDFPCGSRHQSAHRGLVLALEFIAHLRHCDPFDTLVLVNVLDNPEDDYELQKLTNTWKLTSLA